jgi:transposase
LRGLLAEFGVFLPQRIGQLRKHFVDRVEDGNNELEGPARRALMRGWAQWQALDDEIAWFDRQIAEHASYDPQAQRCVDVCGVGRLTASAAVATVVDGRLAGHPAQPDEQRRQAAARAHHQTGNDYLRTRLFQGARSAILIAHRRHDRLSRWIVQLQARVGYYKTLVAVAHARAYPVGGACHGGTVRSVLRARSHRSGCGRVKP